MSLKLHPLKVKTVKRLTKDSCSIYFDIPENEKETFRYKQGQYVSLQVEIDGEKYRREYSICSSPYSDKDFVIASKIVDNGLVSKFLCNDLREGDILEVYPPNGKFFTDLNRENAKTYVLIGGGSGITPLYSILKSVLHVEPQSKVVLYYGNQSEDSIMFRDELEKLELNNKRFDLQMTLSEYGDGWNRLKGKVNKYDLEKIIHNVDEPLEAEYFICGPGAMMDIVNKYLVELGVAGERIHIEYFTAPIVHEEYVPEDEENVEVVGRKVKIILDGDEHTVNVPAGTVILDAVINADLDPPFSCRSGICTTCRAKLHSGKVKMDEREGLSDSEIEDGYILTCQSHPLTEDVVAEYR